jgi:hypothetical protein
MAKTKKIAEKSKPKSNKKQSIKKTESHKMAKTESKEKKQQKQSSPLKKLPEFKQSLTPVLNTPTIIALVVIILVGLAYIFRGTYLAALVNGQPISRIKIMREAEKAQGRQILEQVVLEELVKQKAREEGIQISQELVDSQLDEIKKNVSDQGQDFEQLLSLQGMTEEELRYQIRLQLMIEQLVNVDASVSQEEIDQYLEENKDFLPEEATEEELQQMAQQQLQSQKQNEQYQEWIQKLQDDANINYFVGYAPVEATETE